MRKKIKYIWINKEIVDCFVHFVDRFSNAIIAFVQFEPSIRWHDDDDNDRMRWHFGSFG